MDLPRFASGSVVLEPSTLRYNPHDDIIFPSIFPAGDHLDRPLGRFYLYYAPHSAPGGICLAVADELGGPWREHAKNPIISNAWPPHHEVEHVSSPHALWRADRGELWLYYHGDNETTRWATSKDGLRFDYGGEAVQAARHGMDGASYARVFASPFEAGPAPFLMTLLLYRYVEGSWDSFERYGLHGAWSSDGATWDLVERPILGSQSLEGVDFVCSPSLTRWGDRVFLLYHADEPSDGACISNAYAVEIDASLVPIGPPTLLCRREAFGHGNERISDPYLIVESGRTYLFGSIGPRLGQRIGLSVSDDVAPGHPER